MKVQSWSSGLATRSNQSAGGPSLLQWLIACLTNTDTASPTVLVACRHWLFLHTIALMVAEPETIRCSIVCFVTVVAAGMLLGMKLRTMSGSRHATSASTQVPRRIIGQRVPTLTSPWHSSPRGLWGTGAKT